MSRTAHLASRFSRVFTAEYARRLNAQIASQAAVFKPTELVSAIARPLQHAVFEPDKGPEISPLRWRLGWSKSDHSWMETSVQVRALSSCSWFPVLS
jgi:hypothetical protein